MTKVVAVIQARMGSQRLPGKVLKDLGDRPALDWCVEAALHAPGVDEVVVATSTLHENDVIVDYAKTKKVGIFIGSETDVLSRFIGVANSRNADVLVRLTGDCPFLDPAVISEVIQLRGMKHAEYATNTDPPSYPDGLDVEVFTRAALEAAHKEATRGTDRDCVTRFMVRNRHRFPASNLVCPLPGMVSERWVLDSPEDYLFLTEIVSRLKDKTKPPSYLEILRILDQEPHLRSINSKYSRNERFYDVLVKEDTKRSYTTSQECLKRAERLIPLGAQTFSKSRLQFPEGASPLFVTHGDGGYVFDVDGNDYVDLVGGLLPNILGYRDPDVDAAVADQLSRGISMSLATTLELELAERLNKHIPSAEMIRFGKNGSDVTTAAVRLARYITGRPKVAVGGYHGWHDWSMAVSDRTNGIPGDVRRLSEKFDLEYQQNWLKYAAVIIEPEFYSNEKLKRIRTLCDKEGIILIFDEIITGFRCGLGGLQKVTGVTPDLSCFGKAMANGMPISALVGKKKYMEHMVDISYSGTFFGETLSMAAAIACIDKLERLNVPKYLNITGSYLRSEINILLDKYATDGIKIHGEVELNRIKFIGDSSGKYMQSLFIQEMAKNGVLIIGSHNTCYAHKKPQLDHILSAWDRTLKSISEGVKLDGGIITGKAVR